MLWWIKFILSYSHGNVLFVVIWVWPEQQVLTKCRPAFITAITIINYILQPTTNIIINSLFIIIKFIIIVIAHHSGMINLRYPLLLLPLSLQKWWYWRLLIYIILNSSRCLFAMLFVSWQLLYITSRSVTVNIVVVVIEFKYLYSCRQAFDLVVLSKWLYINCGRCSYISAIFLLLLLLMFVLLMLLLLLLWLLVYL